MNIVEFTDAEIKEDLWAANDLQDRIWEQEKAQVLTHINTPPKCGKKVSNVELS